jgi:hypothetical protein
MIAGQSFAGDRASTPGRRRDKLGGRGRTHTSAGSSFPGSSAARASSLGPVGAEAAVFGGPAATAPQPRPTHQHDPADPECRRATIAELTAALESLREPLNRLELAGADGEYGRMLAIAEGLRAKLTRLEAIDGGR